MDVLLVYLDKVLDPFAQPYGVTIIQGALKRRGIDSSIILPFLAADPYDLISQTLHEGRPRIVGISLRNLDWAGFGHDEDGENHFVQELIDTVSTVRSSGAVVVLGGSGFSIAPNELMDLTHADVGFVGPSETDFAEFCCRVIRLERPVSHAIVDLKTAFLPGMDAPSPQSSVLLAPTSHDPLSLEFARLTGGTIPIRSKSGCSLRCTYCVIPWIESLAMRPWSDICDEIRAAVEQGFGHRIFIADGEFNLPSLDRTIELCRSMVHEFGNTIEWGCYLEAGYVTDELLSAMYAAGCRRISLTVDSLAEIPRRLFGKGTTSACAEAAIERCLRSGIQTTATLLFGGPGETVESAVATAQKAYAWTQRGLQVAATIGLRIYPNTPLERASRLEPYLQFARPGVSLPWLGRFCSPCRADLLAVPILRELPPSLSVTYTATPNDETVAYYQNLAIGARLLRESGRNVAMRWFEELERCYPDKAGPRLGRLKSLLLDD